jgi:pilus assembly protein CpaB
MHRKRLLMIGTMALAIAALVSVAVYRVLKTTLGAAQQADTVVVAAATDLPVGYLLQEKDLRLKRVPGADLPEGTFTATSQAVGRGVLVPIARNEMVLASKLGGTNAGAGLPALIPPGMRAVSVKVNEVVAVAGFVIPGTRVDVLLTGYPGKERDPSTVTTTTVLDNVQVLAAGTRLQHDEKGEAQKVPVITLLVSLEDAQKLTLAASEGRIQLALRNPLDVDPQKVSAARTASLYGTPPAAPVRRIKTVKAPTPPVSTIYVVEMIRGNKRDETKF